MSNFTSTDNKSTTDCTDFISDNQELLARVLARGNTHGTGVRPGTDTEGWQRR